jgi:hypothetical protein
MSVVSIAALAFIVALALPAVRAGAAEEVDIDKMILNAKTPADHEAIAAYYDEQAATAKAKAATHRNMGEDYKKVGGALASKTHFHEHCESLVRSFESAAKDYAAMAAAHREMAKAAKK